MEGCSAGWMLVTRTQSVCGFLGVKSEARRRRHHVVHHCYLNTCTVLLTRSLFPGLIFKLLQWLHMSKSFWMRWTYWIRTLTWWFLLDSRYKRHISLWVWEGWGGWVFGGGGRFLWMDLNDTSLKISGGHRGRNHRWGEAEKWPIFELQTELKSQTAAGEM